MTNTKIIGAQPQQKAMQTPCPQKKSSKRMSSQASKTSLSVWQIITFRFKENSLSL